MRQAMNPTGEKLSINDENSTVWKLQNFTATIFSQKFRQINVLPYYKLHWFDVKNCVVVNFSFFHTVFHCVHNVENISSN